MKSVDIDINNLTTKNELEYWIQRIELLINDRQFEYEIFGKTTEDHFEDIRLNTKLQELKLKLQSMQI